MVDRARMEHNVNIVDCNEGWTIGDHGSTREMSTVSHTPIIAHVST